MTRGRPVLVEKQNLHQEQANDCENNFFSSQDLGIEVLQAHLLRLPLRLARHPHELLSHFDGYVEKRNVAAVSALKVFHVGSYGKGIVEPTTAVSHDGEVQ